MIWYLVVCTSMSNGLQCLPAQPFPSKAACQHVSRGYTRIFTVDRVRKRCLGVPAAG